MDIYHRGIIDRHNFSDEEAVSFANRIEVEAILDQHRDPIVKRTALMMPNLVGKFVLDIGTGEGRWARFMESKGADSVVGLDTSSKMIEIAQRRAQPESLIDYYCEEIDGLEKKDFSFANAFFVTNYIKDLGNFFSEVSMHLSTDGELLFTTKTIELAEDQRTTFKDHLLPISVKDKYKIYSYPHSISDYIETVEKSGFKVVNFQKDLTLDHFSIEELNLLIYEINNLIILCKKV